MPTVIDELVTILGLEVDSGVGQKIRQFNSAVDGITRAVGWASAGLTAAASGILYFAEKANQSAAALYNLGKATGLSTSEVQAFEFAAEQAGGSAAAMRGDLLALQSSMTSPIPGEYNEGLFRLGVNVREASGEVASAEEVFLRFADAIQGMKPQLQWQWAQRAGISQDGLLLAQKGREEILRLREEAKSIPTIVDAKRLKYAQEFVIQLNMLRRIFTYLGQEVSASAAPALEKLTARFSGWLKVNREWVQLKLQNVIDGVEGAFSRLVTQFDKVWRRAKEFFPGLEKWIDKLTQKDVLSGVFYAGLVTLGGFLLAIGAKFFLLAAAVGAAAVALEDVISFFEGKHSVIGDFADTVQEKFPNIIKAFGGLKDAIAEVGFGLLRDALKEIEMYVTSLVESTTFWLEKLDQTLARYYAWKGKKGDEKPIEELEGFGPGEKWGPAEETEASKRPFREKMKQFLKDLGLEEKSAAEIRARRDREAAEHSPSRGSKRRGPLSLEEQARAVDGREEVQPYKEGTTEELLLLLKAFDGSKEAQYRGPPPVMPPPPANVTLNFEVQGTNAAGIAAETAQRVQQTLQTMYPGWYAPVAK